MIELLIALLVIAMGVYLWRTQPRQKTTISQQRATPSSTFHAVEIRSTMNCCQAAADQRGVRYLSNDAPQLPLPGCDAAKCRCRYQHHTDRRDEDRRQVFGATYHAVTESLGQERRNRKDRRQSTT